MLMQQNLSTPLSVKELSSKLDTTERQLTRLFSSYLNAAPATYYRKVRLDHGRNLLLNTTRKVTEIAYATGFSDTSHFALWFRKMYGETPAEFRKRRTGVDV